jgi:MFS family permease
MFMALMAKQEFQKTADAFGLLGSVMAVGSVAGALAIARRTESPTVKQVHGLALAFSLVTVLTGFAPTYEVYLLALPMCGFTALAMLATANSYVQSTTPGEYRGRVMGVYMFVFIGGTPLGSLVVGWLAEAVNPRASIIVSGGIVAVVALVTVLAPVTNRTRNR